MIYTVIYTVTVIKIKQSINIWRFTFHRVATKVVQNNIVGKEIKHLIYTGWPRKTEREISDNREQCALAKLNGWLLAAVASRNVINLRLV